MSLFTSRPALPSPPLLTSVFAEARGILLKCTVVPCFLHPGGTPPALDLPQSYRPAPAWVPLRVSALPCSVSWRRATSTDQRPPCLLHPLVSAAWALVRNEEGKKRTTLGCWFPAPFLQAHFGWLCLSPLKVTAPDWCPAHPTDLRTPELICPPIWISG